MCFSCRQPGHIARDCPQAVNSVLTAGNTGAENQRGGNVIVATAAPPAEQVATYNGAAQALVRPLPPPPPPAAPQQMEQAREKTAVSAVLAPIMTAVTTQPTFPTLPRRVYKVLGALTWEDGSLLTARFLLDTS